MREYIKILENGLISMDSTIEAHLKKLDEAEQLINEAIENEDGTKRTLRLIIDLLHSRWDRSGEDEYHFKRTQEAKPMRARIKLADEIRKTYEDMLVLIRKERAKINEGGAFVQAADLNRKFIEQNRLFIHLKARVRQMSWWNRDRLKTARVSELLKTIEERLHQRRILATKLLDQLREEVTPNELRNPQ